MNIDVNELEVMEDIASLAVVTGEKKEKYLFWQLEISMAHAKRIDLIVSFLMESGVKMLLPQLKQAQKRGVPIRILTGNYLGITQPSALYLLRSELGDQIDLRFYADSHRSFHPKAYFFHADKESRVFIGSSNISRSALTSGIEWNYCLSSVVDKQAFDQFYASFEDLFYNKSVEITDTVLKKYAKSWVRPAVAKDLARYEKQGEEEKAARLDVLSEKIKKSFLKKFKKPDGTLYDVLPENGEPDDASKQVRCNEIFALTMPFTMIEAKQAKAILAQVRRELYTPVGLRSLSLYDPQFHPHYGGTQFERDMAYHQGTVWAYPLGAYYRACIRFSDEPKQTAKEVLHQLDQLNAALAEGCLGQIAEIYDGECPAESRGCFAQAWSVAELLRAYEDAETAVVFGRNI